MSHQNLPVTNLRKSYRATSHAVIINGYRNVIFLPGVGRYNGMWKNNLRDGKLKVGHKLNVLSSFTDSFVRKENNS